MFATSNRRDARIVSLEELRAIRKIKTLPIVIIGGLNLGNIEQFRREKIEGIAVILAIVDAKNTQESASTLKTDMGGDKSGYF